MCINTQQQKMKRDARFADSHSHLSVHKTQTLIHANHL